MLRVVQGIAAAAKQNGGTPALINGSRSISYAALLDAVARISNHFADRRLKPRAKLFINVADPDLRLIVMIAAMHRGLIPFALLDIGDLGAEVDYDYVVGAPELHLPDLAPDVLIDQTVLSGRLSDGTLREFPDQPGDAILFISSTTGTTGRRKMMVETNGVARWKATSGILDGPPGTEIAQPWQQFRPGDRGLSTLGDLTYVGVSLAIECLTAGITHVRVPRDRDECLKLINLYEVSWLRSTPGTLGLLMDGMDERNIACPSVKRVRLLGSLFDQALIERIERHFNAEISVLYAASEIGRISSAVIRSADFEFGYVGTLFPEVRLLTAGTRAQPAPLVMVHNPTTYRPYYSKGKVLPYQDKFYTLPDLGFAEDGRLYLVGRDDEVYNINGIKTAFAAIDAAVRTLPGVRDVAIVSASTVGDVAGLVIGVVSTAAIDTAQLEERVVETVKTRQAAGHLHFFRLDAVPRNAFGKTDREQLIAAYRRQADSERSG